MKKNIIHIKGLKFEKLVFGNYLKFGFCLLNIKKVLLFPLLFSLFLLPHLSFPQTITVKQDGTGDFTTIQAAVDSAQNGDTVLVWPGTYLENIEIISKSITMGSLTLTTGDESYEYQTVIDGNQTGSCIKIYYCTTVTINGFSITNGSGSDCGGICGGGIYVHMANCNILNCNIHNNRGSYHGGGISFESSSAWISNTNIFNNHVYNTGGGIDILKSTVLFDSVNLCNIYENYAAWGTDIYKLGSPSMEVYVDTFTVQNPDYYYVYSKDSMELPQNDIKMHILHHKMEQVFDNLYVSPAGDNNNSGLTPDSALKNISYALLKIGSDSITPDTIFVANGEYSFSNGEKFPLSIKSYVSIIGESKDSTVLNSEHKTYHIRTVSSCKNINLCNFTAKNGGNLTSNEVGSIKIVSSENVYLGNLLIADNISVERSSAGHVFNSRNCVLESVVIENNNGEAAFEVAHASVFSFYDTTIFRNCKFIGNKPDYTYPDYGFGGATFVVGQHLNAPLFTNCYFIGCLFNGNVDKNYAGIGSNSMGLEYSAQVYVSNCTFTENNSENSQGANIGVTYGSNLKVYNSIFYNNYPAEFYMYNMQGVIPSSLSIYNSLVDGGEEGIRLFTDGNILYYDTTNLDTDPLFYGGGEFPYNLSAESPCIDAGTLDLPQFILDNMPETDLAGNPRVFNGKIDMGAYEWNPTVDVKEIPNSKRQIPKLTAAPNPFTTQTLISAKWDNPARVNILIYNSKGLLVKTLQSGRQPAGGCQLIWDGTNQAGTPISAGTYIVILTVNGKETGSVKVVKR